MSGPLTGVRVLELGTLIAGPFCGKTLGDFGAEVIKIEPPGEGDPLRRWRRMRNGTSLWWHVQSRNKKSITLDLRKPEGQAVVRRLVESADIMVENFRPGALERWNLGWDVLSKVNPKLVLVRISGYGQSGPYRERPGFAAIAEAFGGLRHVTGYPDRAPVRPNLSVGDSIASLHGVIGALLGLLQAKNSGVGQVIDVSLFESVFNLTESMMPEYDAEGLVRERSGSSLPGIAPSNAYPCKDGALVLIAANADSLFKRLMTAVGREDLRDDPALARNEGRAAQMARIDEAIGAWTAQRSQQDVLAAMQAAEVPAGTIYTIADIAADPHYTAREAIVQVTAGDGAPLRMPGVFPVLSATPGAIRHAAPALGEHTDEVLRAAGYSDAELAELHAKGIV
ncbi:MAG TPA: CaiB/BaiF CoA-transferase family protein [Burkholderiales bacterium]